MFGTYLIAKDQLYLDKACKVNMADWFEEQGWNTSFCSSSFNAHEDTQMGEIRKRVFCIL